MTAFWKKMQSRWRDANPASRLFWRALAYGILSATFAGALIGGAFSWDWKGRIEDHLMWGYALIGLVYGLIAAPIFGFVMRQFALRLYFRLGDYQPSSPSRFKLVMGLFTLVAVGVTAPYFAVIITIHGLLSGVGIGAWGIMVLLMWGFGVYLSQVLARKYIAETRGKAKLHTSHAEEFDKRLRNIHLETKNSMP